MLSSVMVKYGVANGESYLLVDVSGGIDAHQVQRHLHTLAKLANLPNLDLRVITFDMSVIDNRHFTKDTITNIAAFPIRGGGGTNIVSALDYVVRKHGETGNKAKVFVLSDMQFYVDLAQYESTCEFVWIVERADAKNLRPELKGAHVVF